jgi:N-acetylmuramyl-L-alanine amidase, negative regulator of ampC, ampD
MFNFALQTRFTTNKHMNFYWSKVTGTLILPTLLACNMNAKQHETNNATTSQPEAYEATDSDIQADTATYKTEDNDAQAQPDKNKYKEISYPTPNYKRDCVNEVRGVILHHTAEPTIERSLAVLTSKEKGVGTHCVIDTDGTRYIMCDPTVVTYHAGYSYLDGREGCNNFTIGIEFQGNTLEKPLTKDQIKSAIEYLRPIIAKYDIPMSNIVSHEMIRNAYKKRHPQKRISGKVDITPTEYKRFMKQLKENLEKDNEKK